MRTPIVLTGLLAATLSVAAAAQKPTRTPAAMPAQQQGCPMCGRMMGQEGMRGLRGMGMMDPQMMARMQQMMMPGSLTAASDGTVYALRGGTLYKYDRNLRLQTRTELPAPPMSHGGTAGGHEEHH
ncbi:MAG: hypothetical protein ACK47B_27620 [Armatimonadota bacterium]